MNLLWSMLRPAAYLSTVYIVFRVRRMAMDTFGVLTLGSSRIREIRALRRVDEWHIAVLRGS